MTEPTKCPTLPTFVVIGAQKCFTTTLYEYLRLHPQIFLPDFKETNFFIEEGNWSLGLDWYRSLYRAGDRPDVVHRGDVSPGYTMFPIFAGAPRRMAEHVPDVKLIYVLRDPIERMRSHYMHQLAVGFERRTMRNALLRDIQYLSLSSYALQLEQYLEFFERSQILVLRTEDLTAEPGATLDRLLDFLGLARGWRPANLGRRYNTGRVRVVPRRTAYRVDLLLRRFRRPELAEKVRVLSGRSRWASRPYRPTELDMDDDLRERLRGCLRPEVARLRTIVGPDFDTWGFDECVTPQERHSD